MRNDARREERRVENLHLDCDEPSHRGLAPSCITSSSSSPSLVGFYLLDGLGFRSLQERLEALLSSAGLCRSAEEGRDEGREEGFTDLAGMLQKRQQVLPLLLRPHREMGGSAHGRSRSAELREVREEEEAGESHLAFLCRSAEAGRAGGALHGRSRSAEEGRDEALEEAPEATGRVSELGQGRGDERGAERDRRREEAPGAGLEEPGRGLTDLER